MNMSKELLLTKDRGDLNEKRNTKMDSNDNDACNVYTTSICTIRDTCKG